MTKTVLDEIKQALMAANAVQGEQEFCVAWLGKNASYMRVLRFQQLQPSADALAVCASKNVAMSLQLLLFVSGRRTRCACRPCNHIIGVWQCVRVKK